MEDVLRSHAPANIFEGLGLMAFIAMGSGYSDLRVDEMEAYLLPALDARQFKIYLDQMDRPHAFVTWALFDDECHAAMLATGRTPPADRWRSGHNLWFMDIVAPHGNARHIIRDLQRNHFPDKHGHSIKRNLDGSVNRVKVWRNALVRNVL